MVPTQGTSRISPPPQAHPVKRMPTQHSHQEIISAHLLILTIGAALNY